ncbi:MAG: alcohol dehydrogenase catalytic domain-containing protein [Phycisphaerales bacterium]
MRAARIESGNVVVDPSYPDPTPDPTAERGTAIVRVSRVLITETDRSVLAGVVPHTGVLGQAFVGTVERIVGDDPRNLAGRRVVSSPDLPDPSSSLAQRGLGAHDPDRTVLGVRGRDGCLADLLAVPTAALVPVPDAVDADRAVFALPLARALHAAQIVRIPGKTYVTILGDNLRALLAAQVLARLNASVRLLGTMPDRLDRCARWGVKHRHRDEAGLWGDQDIVVDSERDVRTFELACGMVRPRGTIVLLGETPAGESRSSGDLALVIEREITVIGARCGSLGEGVSMLGSGMVDLDGLISKRFKLEDAEKAIRAAGDPASIAVIVDADR